MTARSDWYVEPGGQRYIELGNPLSLSPLMSDSLGASTADRGVQTPQT